MKRAWATTCTGNPDTQDSKRKGEKRKWVLIQQGNGGTPAKFRLGRSSHTGRVGAGRVEVGLRCVRSLREMEGICHPSPAAHTGTRLKQERLDSNLSRLVLNPRNPPAPAHPRRPPRLHPTLSHPVTLPACLPAHPQDLPVGWPRSSFSIHRITIPTPSRSRLNPIPSQGPQAADCAFIALRPAADTLLLRDIGDRPPSSRCPSLFSASARTSARPMAS